MENELIAVREELEANRLAAANGIRLGVVTNPAAATVDVVTGDNKATGVPFLVMCSGKVSHYRRPSEGEQCLLVNLGSGDNLNNAVALMGLPSDRYPVPTTKANEVMTDYGGGMTEVYDLEKGSLTAKYPGGLNIVGDTRQTGAITATGDITDYTRSMQADREIFDGHDHNESNLVKTEVPNQKQAE
ncbi:baseplate assembly protein [Veronia pacifica]|uniref:Baseplate assembly protein n=1 Tax=Veronia pacifica TaxID=1080227 RepID=A0A1C3E9H9_9GAMM|nr:baseplate assembly protein [Veronia pacifica]